MALSFFEWIVLMGSPVCSEISRRFQPSRDSLRIRAQSVGSILRTVGIIAKISDSVAREM